MSIHHAFMFYCAYHDDTKLPPLGDARITERTISHDVNTCRMRAEDFGMVIGVRWDAHPISLERLP
jgi:hypothetical protein